MDFKDFGTKQWIIAGVVLVAVDHWVAPECGRTLRAKDHGHRAAFSEEFVASGVVAWCC